MQAELEDMRRVISDVFMPLAEMGLMSIRSSETALSAP
jgi:hypothetical protein